MTQNAVSKKFCKVFCKLLLYQLTFVSHDTQWLRGTYYVQVLST